VAGVRALIEARGAQAVVSAAVLAGLQSHRTGLVQDERAAAGGQSPYPASPGRCGSGCPCRYHPGQRCRLVPPLRISDTSTMKPL
jgi:hypothetical protein